VFLQKCEKTHIRVISTVPETEREKRIDDGEIALQGKGEGQVDRHHHRALKIRITQKRRLLVPESPPIYQSLCLSAEGSWRAGCFDECVF
jgi:hypothetical protein